MLKRIIKTIIGEKRIMSFRKWQKSRRLRRYGDDALNCIAKVCNDMGVNYWMMFGSLLGAYRERGFIKHDDDLDLAIMSDDINKHFINALIEKGFLLDSIKETSTQSHRMVSFIYHRITVDFYGFTRDERNILTGFCSVPLEGGTYEESRRKNLYRAYFVHYQDEGIKMTPFNNYFVPIPVNTPSILEGLYGKTFMKPIKDKRIYTATNADILPIEQMQAYIISYNQLP